MKLRIGTKLSQIRQERHLTQDQLAELLGFSTSAYSRYERNETSMDMETLTRVSKVLDTPIHEFLPETLQINNNNHQSQGSCVFGNFYYYANQNDALEALQKENAALKERLDALEAIMKNKG